MSPRRKTRSMTNRQNAFELQASALRKKAIPEETNVDEWVYRFLGNLAAIERDREETKKRNMTLKSNVRSQSLKAARVRLRSPTPYAWTPLGHPTNSDDEDDALITPMRKARTPVGRDLLLDGPHVANRDPTLLQKINRYIRAGIAEGKRRAKSYVLKALTFAEEMGYLVPVDRSGKLLRVSPALIAAGKPLQQGRTRRPQRKRSGRSGRVRKASKKVRMRKSTKASRRKAQGSKSAAAGEADKPPIALPKRKRNDDTRENKTTSRQQPDKWSRNGELEKSKKRPNSSPSRRSYRRQYEDLAPVMSKAGSAEAIRKPLSARSRSSSFTRRSRDDDIFA